jgi:hypothetical protein
MLMSNNRTKHSSQDVSKKLKKILFELNNWPLTLQKKELLLKKVQDLLEEKIVKQILQSLSLVCDQKKSTHKNIEKKILQHYDELESEMLAETKSLEVKYVFELSQSTQQKPDHMSDFEWRESGIIVAFHYFLEEKNQLSYLSTIFSENNIRDIGHMFAQRLDNKYLQEIRNEVIYMGEIAKSYVFIKKFGAPIKGREEKWKDLSTHIHRLGSYINDQFMVAESVIFLKIEKITWEYYPHDNPSKVSLVICIDGVKCGFTGLTAMTIYNALLMPHEFIEYEDVPLKKVSQNSLISANVRNYGAIYRRIEDINNRFSEAYADYKCTDFIIREGYSYCINPKYADLIDPI